MNDGHMIERTPFLIDCFRGPLLQNAPGSAILVLTHAHADHYGGLDERWSGRQVHCSPATARFVCAVLHVDSSLVAPLELMVVHAFGSHQLVLLDAGHCPGSCMVLIRRPDGSLALHTGDCRFVAAEMVPELLQAVHLLDPARMTTSDPAASLIDDLYLDTTYAAGPGVDNYTFAPQAAAVDFLALRISRLLDEDRRRADGRQTLILIGTYLVGKERLLARISRDHPDVSIICTERRLRAISALLDLPGGPVLHDEDAAAAGAAGADRLTNVCDMRSAAMVEGLDNQGVLLHELRTDLRGGAALVNGIPVDGRRDTVQVIPIAEIGLFAPGNWRFLVDWPTLRGMLQHHADDSYRLEAFVPTGWAFKLGRYAAADVTAVDCDFPHTTQSLETGEPIRVTCFAYSEHSSFDQLRSLVEVARPSHLVPTVVPPPGGGRAVSRIVAKFEDLMNRQQRTANAFTRLFGKAAGKEKTNANANAGTPVMQILPALAPMQPSVPSPVRSGGSGSRSSDTVGGGGRCTASESPPVHVPMAQVGRVGPHGHAMDMLFGRSPSPRKRRREPERDQQLQEQLDTLISAGILPSSVHLSDVLPLVEALPHGTIATADYIASSYFESSQKPPALAFDLACGANAGAPECSASNHHAQPDNLPPIPSSPKGNIEAIPGASSSSPSAAKTPMVQAAIPTPPSSAPFNMLAGLCGSMENEKGRLKLRDLMCSCLHKLAVEHPEDLLFAVRFLSGELTDPHTLLGGELGVGYRILSNAVKEALNISDKALRTACRKHGDLGLAAQEARQSRPLLFAPARLTCEGVFRAFQRIAAAGGKGGVQAKTSVLKKLLVAAQGLEVRYIIR